MQIRTRVVAVIIVLLSQCSNSGQPIFAAQPVPTLQPCEQEAASYLGLDFVSTAEVMKNFPGVVYTTVELQELCKTIPTGTGRFGELRWIKDGNYRLVPGPPQPMSISEVRVMTKAVDRTIEGDKIPFGWLAIKMTPLEKSVGESLKSQVKRLSGFERLPNAAEVIWFANISFEVRKPPLFEKDVLRTATIGPNGNHSVVRLVEGEYVALDSSTDGADPHIGLASAGKR